MTSIVGISIVNYKTAPLVKECLASMANDNRTHENTRIVVVDNDSGDGSAEELTRYVSENGWNDWIEVVPAGRNGGFSYGNNIAFKRLCEKNCDYLWLVNPDTQLLPGACEALVAALEGDATVGAVGSRLEDVDGTPQIAAFNFPTPFGEFVNTSGIGLVYRRFPERVVPRPLPDQPVAVDWVAGASMMLSRKVVDRIGLMDEKYFLYFEEVDYCIAIRKAGFKIMYIPESRVIHHVGAATGISDTRKQAPRRPVYWFESRQRFFQKNYGLPRTLLADGFWVVAYSVKRLKDSVQRRECLDPPFFLRDFIRHSSFFRGRASQ